MKWNEDDIRRFGHEVSDIVAEYFPSLESAPVGPRRADDLERLFSGPLPEEGADPFALLAELRTDILPNAFNLASPHYFGLFNPSVHLSSVAADALVAAFVEPASGETIDVVNTLGDVEQTRVPAWIQFELRGVACSWAPFSLDEEGVFLAFANRTNGSSTYPGGRFLRAAPPVGGRLTLDFNRRGGRQKRRR